MWSKPETFQRRPHELPKNVLDAYSYDKGKFVALEKAKIDKSWEIVPNWKPADGTKTRGGFVNVPMLYTDKAGATFRFKFKGRGVGLFMACGPKSCILEYTIDGKTYPALDTFTAWSKRLYLPWLHVLAAELDPSKEHELVLKVSSKSNKNSKGTECVIRNIVVNE